MAILLGRAIGQRLAQGGARAMDLLFAACGTAAGTDSEPQITRLFHI
jgi:hypothetical protein